MSYRRRFAPAALALAGLALTACGGAASFVDAGAAADGHGDAAAKQPSAAPSNAFGPGSAVDAASVKQMFGDAIASATTVHVDMTMTGQVAMSGSGDMDMSAKPLKASLQLGSSSLGGDITMLMVDDAMYLKSKVFGDKYMKISTTGKDSPLAQMGLDSLDPTAMFGRFGDAVSGGTYVGKETVDGTATDHYRLNVDTKALMSALPSAAAGTAVSIPKSETIDVWFDGDGRYKKMATEVGSESVTETFSKWGEPVHVTAPSAGEVQDMTSLLTGQMGKIGQ